MKTLLRFSLTSLAQAFLLKGIAVVSMDLRGSGASFGSNGGPWLEQETEDSQEVLRWVSEVEVVVSDQ